MKIYASNAKFRYARNYILKPILNKDMAKWFSKLVLVPFGSGPDYIYVSIYNSDIYVHYLFLEYVAPRILIIIMYTVFCSKHAFLHVAIQYSARYVYLWAIESVVDVCSFRVTELSSYLGPPPDGDPLTSQAPRTYIQDVISETPQRSVRKI